jgi:hypothetical protein
MNAKTNRSLLLIAALLAVPSLLACDSGSTGTEPGSGGPAPSTPAPGGAPGGEWRPTESPAETPRIEIGEEAFRGAGEVLPRPVELADWSYVEEPTYFSGSNLFELMDGGGAAFVRIGMVDTAYGLFEMNTPPAELGRPAGLEIYVHRMNGATEARTKWDEDHASGRCDQVDGIGLVHCETYSTLDLLSGQYYVRLVLDSDLEVIRTAMRNAAQAVIARLPEPAGAEGTGAAAPPAPEGAADATGAPAADQ